MKDELNLLSKKVYSSNDYLELKIDDSEKILEGKLNEFEKSLDSLFLKFSDYAIFNPKDSSVANTGNNLSSIELTRLVDSKMILMKNQFCNENNELKKHLENKINNVWSSLKALRTGYQMNEINIERLKSQDKNVNN